jgi:hypothetical protein
MKNMALALFLFLGLEKSTTPWPKKKLNKTNLFNNSLLTSKLNLEALK